MQTAFWSKLECISDHAIAFDNIKDIQNYIMTKFYKELEPYDDYYGKAFDFKIHKIIGCNSNYISLTKLQ
jgi:hypothetical protein